MKNQVFNPFLPLWEYIPDGEPHVFGDRVYLFGSHDRFNGTQFCMNDYVCWSAPVDDLSDWKCHGVMYRASQDPHAKGNGLLLAPDVCRGTDGKFYLYYNLGMFPATSVAVAEKPEGPYAYYGMVRRKDGTPVGTKLKDVLMFDPGVLADDDGSVYLYAGFGPDVSSRSEEEASFFQPFCEKFKLNGAYAFSLEPDMLTVKQEYGVVVPYEPDAKGTGFEGHGFFEASSMRKIDGKYYFIYSSVLSHELCWAVSDAPVGPFRYGGTLISNGDLGLNGNTIRKNYTGNNHGSLVKINEQWYVFYHRQTNRHMFSRQACAERIAFENGIFRQAPITSCGLNPEPLKVGYTYPAAIACHLTAEKGAISYGTSDTANVEGHPYFTQTGEDRESDADQYIANLQNGAEVGYKYFDLNNLARISVCVSGFGRGILQVFLDEDRTTPVCSIDVQPNGKREGFHGAINGTVNGVHPLYFRYSGEGSIHFHDFTLTGK